MSDSEDDLQQHLEELQVLKAVLRGGYLGEVEDSDDKEEEDPCGLAAPGESDHDEVSETHDEYGEQDSFANDSLASDHGDEPVEVTSVADGGRQEDNDQDLLDKLLAEALAGGDDDDDEDEDDDEEEEVKAAGGKIHCGRTGLCDSQRPQAGSRRTAEQTLQSGATSSRSVGRRGLRKEDTVTENGEKRDACPIGPVEDQTDSILGLHEGQSSEQKAEGEEADEEEKASEDGDAKALLGHGPACMKSALKANRQLQEHLKRLLAAVEAAQRENWQMERAIREAKGREAASKKGVAPVETAAPSSINTLPLSMSAFSTTHHQAYSVVWNINGEAPRPPKLNMELAGQFPYVAEYLNGLRNWTTADEEILKQAVRAMLQKVLLEREVQRLESGKDAEVCVQSFQSRCDQLRSLSLESQELQSALPLCGEQEWREMALQHLKDRDWKDCRAYYLHVLQPSALHPWSKEENTALRKAALNNKEAEWARIADEVEEVTGHSRPLAVYLRHYIRALRAPEPSRGGSTGERFSPMTDKRLKALVNKFGHDWNRVALAMKGVTSDQVMMRYEEITKEVHKKGGFAPEEDERLLKAVEKYGCDWLRVAQEVGQRTRDQCRHRYLDALDPSINRLPWSMEELKTLENGVQEHMEECGRVKWHELVPRLRGRTDNQCIRVYALMKEYNFDYGAVIAKQKERLAKDMSRYARRDVQNVPLWSSSRLMSVLPGNRGASLVLPGRSKVVYFSDFLDKYHVHQSSDREVVLPDILMLPHVHQYDAWMKWMGQRRFGEVVRFPHDVTDKARDLVTGTTGVGETGQSNTNKTHAPSKIRGGRWGQPVSSMQGEGRTAAGAVVLRQEDGEKQDDGVAGSHTPLSYINRVAAGDTVLGLGVQPEQGRVEDTNSPSRPGSITAAVHRQTEHTDSHHQQSGPGKVLQVQQELPGTALVAAQGGTSGQGNSCRLRRSTSGLKGLKVPSPDFMFLQHYEALLLSLRELFNTTIEQIRPAWENPRYAPAPPLPTLPEPQMPPLVVKILTARGLNLGLPEPAMPEGRQGEQGHLDIHVGALHECPQVPVLRGSLPNSSDVRQQDAVTPGANQVEPSHPPHPLVGYTSYPPPSIDPMCGSQEWQVPAGIALRQIPGGLPPAPPEACPSSGTALADVPGGLSHPGATALTASLALEGLQTPVPSRDVIVIDSEGEGPTLNLSGQQVDGGRVPLEQPARRQRLKSSKSRERLSEYVRRIGVLYNVLYTFLWLFPLPNHYGLFLQWAAQQDLPLENPLNEPLADFLRKTLTPRFNRRSLGSEEVCREPQRSPSGGAAIADLSNTCGVREVNTFQVPPEGSLEGKVSELGIEMPGRGLSRETVCEERLVHCGAGSVGGNVTGGGDGKQGKRTGQARDGMSTVSQTSEHDIFGRGVGPDYVAVPGTKPKASKKRKLIPLPR